MLGEIFPVDMWAIVPLTALTFIVLSDAIDSLAEHYAWLRLSRAGAYAVGVGMILVFFLIDSLLNDDLGSFARLVWIVLAAGVPTIIKHMADPDKGPRIERLRAGSDKTNTMVSWPQVVAYLETMAAMAYKAHANEQENAESWLDMALWAEYLRQHPEVSPLEISIRDRKRIIAQWVQTQKANEK